MKTYIDNQGSRFAEEHEIRNIAIEVDCSEDTISAGGVPVISDGKTAYIMNHDCHSVIFGATGSKKTRNIIQPTLACLVKNGESMVVNDPKGELYKKTKPLLDRQGYSTHVLNFRDPNSGSRWNPLTIVYTLYKEGKVDKSNMYLRDVAQCIYSKLAANCNDDFWTSTAEDYFVGLAQLLRDEVKENAFTIENIRLVHSLGNNNFATSRYINEYCGLKDQNSEMVANLNGTINAPNETRGGITSVFSQPLSLYSQNNLCDMLCESDFKFSEIGKKKTAIFLITPDERSAYNPIITTFIKLCYGVLIDTAESQECGGSLPVRVNFVIDEFSNLPAIPDLNAMISAARSRNIRFDLVVQSLAQLYKNYSETIAENVITNCEIWYVLRSNDSKLHSRIREMCGSHVSEYLHTEKPLIDTITIQRLDKERGEVLIKILGQYPFITELPDIDEYEFNMPDAEEVVFTLREPKKRKIFDIQKVTKERKRAKLFEAMENQPKKKTSNPAVPKIAPPDLGMESFIRQIYKEIDALEAEEKREREQSLLEQFIKDEEDKL